MFEPVKLEMATFEIMLNVHIIFSKTLSYPFLTIVIYIDVPFLIL